MASLRYWLIVSNNESSSKIGAQLKKKKRKNITRLAVTRAVSTMGGMVIINMARSRSGFVKISRAFTRHKTMLFPSSLISSRCRGTSRFIRPSPGNPFFPSARGPSYDHLRDICRVSRRAFHPGMSQRAVHESRAMQWPRQVRRDECETRSNRVSTDNQTQHDNFHRCRSRSIRWSERDRRTRPFKRKTKTLRGEEVNEGRAMRKKRKEKGMETEERHILCGHSRFSTLSGNASSLDPRPRGQRKELVNVNLLMASAPGPFWEFRFLFFFLDE